MLKNILNGLAGIFHSKSEISRIIAIKGSVVVVYGHKGAPRIHRVSMTDLL